MSSNEKIEARYLLAAVVESSEDSIVSIDLNRIVTSWNNSAERLYGYSAAEVIGKPLSIVMLPEDIKELIDKVDNIIHEEIVDLYDTVRIHKDGKDLNLEIMLSPVKNSSGQVVGISTIARDVTKRQQIEANLRQSNELLRITFEHATDYAIITFDASGKTTSWSKGAELIFGYSEAEARGQHTSLIFTPEDRASGAPERELQTACEMGRAEDERWHISKDGNRFFMSGVMTSIMNETGVLVGYAKIARDITKRKLQEEQKDEFIKIASHELKTPVTSLKAFTEILLERFEDHQDQQSATMLRKLDGQVDRLIHLINTLLDTTRLSAGEIPIHAETLDLNQVITEEMEVLETVSQKHSLIFRPGKIQPIAADRRLIEQVLVNLITNAIKYSPDGGDVIVSTTGTDREIVVAVQDFGIGIPASAIDKIFDRYFRVPNKLSTFTSGIGLGLYVTDNIVRRHGGISSVQSKEGEGSIFTFTLPYGWY